jgi:hypothetical protein
LFLIELQVSIVERPVVLERVAADFARENLDVAALFQRTDYRRACAGRLDKLSESDGLYLIE